MAVARDNRQSLETQKLSTEGIVSKIQNNIEILENAITETVHKITAMTQSTDENDLPQGDDALINHLNVTEGYEKAVSSALGQWASMAGLDDNASIYWSAQSTTIDTPKGTKPLSDFVGAPSALTPLLNAIGVVDELSSQTLTAGQMIVARDGSFMRWDGLIVKANGVHNNDQTHIILEQITIK